MNLLKTIVVRSRFTAILVLVVLGLSPMSIQAAATKENAGRQK
jgi:hypothetical protein